MRAIRILTLSPNLTLGGLRDVCARRLATRLPLSRAAISPRYRLGATIERSPALALALTLSLALALAPTRTRAPALVLT